MKRKCSRLCVKPSKSGLHKKKRQLKQSSLSSVRLKNKKSEKLSSGYKLKNKKGKRRKL